MHLFADRLVDKESVRRVEGLILKLLRSQFGFESDLTNVFYSAIMSEGVTASSGGGAGGGSSLGKCSSEIGDTLDRVSVADYTERVTESLFSYERSIRQLNLQLFPETLQQIVAQERIISQPGGSLLLVGSAGVGRRETIALTAHMHRMSFWTPAITREYTSKNFRSDCKDVMARAGVSAEKIVFFIEDHQIVHNSMLEDINSMLCGGEIAGLYTNAELDAVLGPLKDDFQRNGTMKYRNVGEYFRSRVQVTVFFLLFLSSSSLLLLSFSSFSLLSFLTF